MLLASFHIPLQDTPADARSANMAGDLGQVEYVFSDKTGTLTQNVMKFKRCSVGGTIYGEIEQAAKDLMTSQQLSVRKNCTFFSSGLGLEYYIRFCMKITDTIKSISRNETVITSPCIKRSLSIAQADFDRSKLVRLKSSWTEN